MTTMIRTLGTPAWPRSRVPGLGFDVSYPAPRAGGGGPPRCRAPQDVGAALRVGGVRVPEVLLAVAVAALVPDLDA